MQNTHNPVAQKTSTQKALEILHELDELFVTDSVAAEYIWNILTALRGPDKHASHNKVKNVTIAVRARAFPLTARYYGDMAHFSNYPMFAPIDPLEGEDPTDGGMHFEHHAFRAKETLDFLGK